MFGKIKRRQSDILFSRYLRLKIGKCEVCLKPGEMSSSGEPIVGLEVSHYWSRRHESVRFSEDNVDVFCFYHHRFFEENPGAYHDWKIRKLGEKKYRELEIAKETFCKRDEKMALIFVKNLLKKLIENKRI